VAIVSFASAAAQTVEPDGLSGGAALTCDGFPAIEVQYKGLNHSAFEIDPLSGAVMRQIAIIFTEDDAKRVDSFVWRNGGDKSLVFVCIDSQYIADFDMGGRLSAAHNVLMFSGDGTA
jgi:hypothetical protein